MICKIHPKAGRSDRCGHAISGFESKALTVVCPTRYYAYGPALDANRLDAFKSFGFLPLPSQAFLNER
jgi:hypothetical protein